MMEGEVRIRYFRSLVTRIREDKYPSVAQMDRVEAMLPPELIAPYVDMLLDKMDEDMYPSPPMMRRVERLVASMPMGSTG